MDAMGTQTEIARAIRDGGVDYCVSLKKNWPVVYADVEQLFNDPPDDVVFETHETADLTGGRIETRRHTVCHKVDWMTSDRHYPGEPVFPDLAMVGRIETDVERNGKTEYETRYYLCSLALCALTSLTPCGRIGGGKPPALGVGRGPPRRSGTLQHRSTTTNNMANAHPADRMMFRQATFRT